MQSHASVPETKPVSVLDLEINQELLNRAYSHLIKEYAGNVTIQWGLECKIHIEVQPCGAGRRAWLELPRRVQVIK